MTYRLSISVFKPTIMHKFNIEQNIFQLTYSMLYAKSPEKNVHSITSINLIKKVP